MNASLRDLSAKYSSLADEYNTKQAALEERAIEIVGMFVVLFVCPCCFLCCFIIFLAKLKFVLLLLLFLLFLLFLVVIVFFLSVLFFAELFDVACAATYCLVMEDLNVILAELDVAQVTTHTQRT